MKVITDHEIIDHGIMGSQYFQGCGTSCTDFVDVATGIGEDAAEAYDDALDFLAQNDWDTEPLERTNIDTTHTVTKLMEEYGIDMDECDSYYYLSIRVC